MFLKPTNNTLKCEIKNNIDIDFKKNYCIGSILDYSVNLPNSIERNTYSTITGRTQVIHEV